MAAYAAITSLEKTTEQLMIVLQTHGGDGSSKQSKQLREEIELLSQSTKFLRGFLEQYPRDIPDYLEAQIRDTGNIADEIIGRFVSGQCSKLADDDDDAITVSHVLPAKDVEELCHQLRQLRVSNDMSSVVEKINAITSEVVPDKATPTKSSSPRNYVPTSKEDLIGLWDVYRRIKGLVTGISSDLQVISLLGIGGSGKTTLARKLYDYLSTSEEFEICGWVSVSRDYSVGDILLSLVKSIQPFVKEPKQRTESAESYLHRNLEGKRFFIVLDDVWSEEALGFLMRILPDDGNRSRILITTRMEKVANEATPVESMRVMTRPLTDEESWKLFELKAFKQETCPCELEERARIVSRGCQGLPILIVLVAGILPSTGGNKSEFECKLRELMNILSSDTRVNSVYEVVDLILSLSYAHLDHRLRSCFLYMGVFPEDYEIKVSKLTKLWIAQGFMEEQSSSLSWPPKRCEEGEECLNELVNRNLVTIQKMKSNGCSIKSCSLHDMVRDYCIKKSHEDGFFHCVKGNFADAVSRTVVTFDPDNLKRVCDSDSNDGAHTIMCFGHGHNRLISLRRFRLLKTLDMVNVEHKSFPVEVLELFLLKLLALSHIPELPPSISKLRYLEALIIHPRDTSETLTPLPCIVCLPPEIWTMMQLRHLISFCWGILPDPPEGETLSLRNLHTLSAVMNLDGREETWLRMFPNIKKLAVFYFGVGRATHSLKRLQSLRRLEKLKVWVLAPFSSPQKLELCYSATIRKLNLRGIELTSADMNLIGKLPYLQVLKLKQNAFEDDEWRTSFTEFSMLEHLQLEELSLKLWVFNEDFLVLHRLKSLVVRACNRLCEIPMGVADIETLKQIEVVGGKKSLTESVRRIIEKRRRSFYHRYEKLELRLLSS